MLGCATVLLLSPGWDFGGDKPMMWVVISCAYMGAYSYLRSAWLEIRGA